MLSQCEVTGNEQKAEIDHDGREMTLVILIVIVFVFVLMIDDRWQLLCHSFPPSRTLRPDRSHSCS